jgi:two-component system phosphate regulon sensor histidine kinase PhoR
MIGHEKSKRLSPVERIAAMSHVGAALMSELDEDRLLCLIAATARESIGAAFAAFTLRPVNDEGEPLVPSEGSLFHLAAIVGVSSEQEALFRRMPLGGEGLLAPIFRHGIPVRVDDALTFIRRPEELPTSPSTNPHETVRQAAFAYAHGRLSLEGLHSIGVPRGHPVVRSFLGAPLLNHRGQVRGGLLLGHPEPGRFTYEDEVFLVGLATQAAVALEHAQLYRTSQMRAQELKALFESIADGVTLVDQQGTILRENRAARHLREQLEDAPEGEQVLNALLHVPARRALNAEAGEDSVVSVTDGSNETREYLVNASPLRQITTSSGPLFQSNGSRPTPQKGVSGAVVIWHDVTERRLRESEHQATAQAKQLEEVFEAITDGVFVYDNRGNIVQMNTMARTLFAFDAVPDYVSRPLEERLAQLVVRDTRGRVLPREQWPPLRLLKGEVLTGANAMDVLVRTFDGREVQVSIGGAPLYDQVGRIIGAVMTTRDMTERLRLEQEAERLKDEFIAIAAHELRNPLALLKGYAQMLLFQNKRGRGPALADWQNEALQNIDKATAGLVELTEDLLDVTRLQAGRLVLHLKPSDLVALAQRMVKRLQMTTEQHSLSVVTSLEHLVVPIDPGRIEQVLGNIINNAIKYSPEGGPIEVTIREEIEANEALLSIRDQGIGIPAHQQTRIFGRFERADNARTYQIGGTGLGLYLCRAIVEQHGGRLWFESTEGQGSTFFIALPITSE